METQAEGNLSPSDEGFQNALERHGHIVIEQLSWHL
jgi:hypothetical protein